MKTIKARIRIETGQYEFIEADVEDTPENIIALQRDIKKMVKGGEGLPPKEWNRILDNCLKGQNTKMLPEEHENMDKLQQWFIDEIKKAFKRIN